MREHFPFQAAQSAIVDMLHDYLAEKEHAERLEIENALLKAEVERLTARNKGANMEAEEHCRRAMELRKAGDGLVDAIQTYFELLPMLVNEVRAKAMLKGRKAIQAWNAAKEGKPSV